MFNICIVVHKTAVVSLPLTRCKTNLYANRYRDVDEGTGGRADDHA